MNLGTFLSLEIAYATNLGDAVYICTNFVGNACKSYKFSFSYPVHLSCQHKLITVTSIFFNGDIHFQGKCITASCNHLSAKGRSQEKEKV